MRASTAVDEMEAVYMNLTMLRAELNISTTESSAESIYDTLDKVVKESKNHTFPKVTAQRGEGGREGEKEREGERDRKRKRETQ